MISTNYKIPLILSVILILSAVVPVIPFLILFFNEGLISLLELIFGDFLHLEIIVNALFSILFLVLNYKSKRNIGEWVYSISFILFFLPFMTYILYSGSLFQKSHFSGFLVIGLLITTILVFFKFLKSRVKNE